MSRKHFRAIAEAIKNIPDAQVRQTMAEAMASVCASLNPRFKRSVFMEACGVSS